MYDAVNTCDDLIIPCFQTVRRPALLAVISKHIKWLIIEEGKSAYHLIYDLLHPMLTLQSSVVDVELSKALGSLVCITAGGGIISWPDGVRCKTEVWEVDCIKCLQCDRGECARL